MGNQNQQQQNQQRQSSAPAPSAQAGQGVADASKSGESSAQAQTPVANEAFPKLEKQLEALFKRVAGLEDIVEQQGETNETLRVQVAELEKQLKALGERPAVAAPPPAVPGRPRSRGPKISCVALKGVLTETGFVAEGAVFDLPAEDFERRKARGEVRKADADDKAA